MRILASVVVAAAVFGSMPAFAAPEVPAGVKPEPRGDGWNFVDAKGLALYTFERDERTPGLSACDADCAKAWPPLAAAADAKPVGDWTTIKRQDGSKQWAFKGHPLYGYAAEGGPGTTYGDGQGGTWFVAYEPIPMPIEFTINNALLGRVLADSRGMTIYTYDRDTSGKSACTGTCLNDWMPVEAPLAAAAARDPWSTVTRADGTKQWAYQGKPLYRYIHEATAGETAGDGVGKAWHAMILRPSEPYPVWVTVQGSDAGALLADSQGHTIYTHNAVGGRRGFGAVAMCGGEPCLAVEWKPIMADAEAKGEGDWSIVASKDGTRQWAYRGMKLYTNVQDMRPGDFLGIRFGGDRSWATIMRSGLPMQGVSVGGG